MTENKKDKNKNTKAILERSFDLYKKFLDNPSKRNLNAFMEVAENYKEAFIEDTSDFINTSSKDLNIENTFNKDVSMLPMRTVSHMSPPSSENMVIDHSKSEEKSINDFLMKVKKWEEGGKLLKDTQILNRLIGHNTSELIPPIQNTNSIRRDNILKDIPQKVNSFKNKGPVKLFSNYVNIPESFFAITGLNIPTDITFLEFKIAKYRYVLYTDDNTAYQWVRPFPRRWYMEENKDKGRIPWFEDRAEIQPIFREFNKWNPIVINGQDSDEFFRMHDSGSAEFYNSDHLSSIRRHEIFHDFCLNEDEFLKFIDEQNGYKFLFCESIQNRSLDQILRNKEARWIDICFYNDSNLTIRSFTDDKEFMPRCRDYRNPHVQKKFPWVMTNEMPKLPYSVIKFFSEELEKDFLENTSNENGMSKKDQIYDLYKNPPEEVGTDLSIEEIAFSLRLDPAYTEDVLEEILNEKEESNN